MKKQIVITLFFTALSIFSSPRINFTDLLVKAELNPQLIFEARKLASSQWLPVNILTRERIMIDAKGIEDGKVVYAVITDMLNPYNGGYTAFFSEIQPVYSPSNSRTDYGNGKVTDNTGGIFNPVIYPFTVADQYLMIVGWTLDKCYLLSAQNGDIVDTNFIPQTNPQLQSPKTAMQHFSGRYIIVADQISDVVQKFDTNGTYIGFYAPSTGPNTSLVDNMRGIRYRPNRNLLVTVASSANANTIQEFDTGGVHIGTFIPVGHTPSPFDIMIRSNDILISNSSAPDITKFDLNGTYISDFHNSTNISFAQQMFRLPDGRIAVSGFSTPNSGLTLLDSAGNYIRTMSVVTGNRGVYLLGNGHYLITNSTGAHEIDSATGSLIRSVLTFGDLQYIAPYTPGWVLSGGNNSGNIPGFFRLKQNYPNPFNPATKLRFEIPEAGFTALIVYDVSGKEIKTLISGELKPGKYEINFDGSGLASGVYYYKLISGGFSDVKKMVLIK